MSTDQADPAGSEGAPDSMVVARRIDITPRRPVTLGCSHGAGNAPISRVAEPLEADILAVADPGGPVVLVTLDSLYPARSLREAVLAACPALRPDRLVIAASHTHQAPMLFDDYPGLGLLAADYCTDLGSTLGSAVAEAVESLTVDARPARWFGSRATAHHGINRRRPTRRGIRMSPNPGGPTDENIAVVVLREADGSPVAVLWNYACHPVGHPDQLAVSAHFPHVVRQRLRAFLKAPELPVLFLQGFSGDVRPNNTLKIRDLRSLARRIRWGVSFNPTRPSAYAEWTRSLAEVVVQALPDGADLTPTAVAADQITLPLTDFVDGAADRVDPRQVRFQSLAFGERLGILAVSAEVVSEYAAMARRLSPSGLLMCVGCTDDSFGYIPTQQMMTEGGYEAGGYCRAFGYTAVRPDIGTRTEAAIASVLAGTGLSAGRTNPH